MRRAVFLDRDGVLNRAFSREGRPVPPASVDDFEILPGVPAALRALSRAGLLLIVVTNQPDVARGTQNRQVVEAMHSLLRSKLPIDDIRVCWDSDSSWYKPKPGMLLAAARDWGIDLPSSYMVGDRWRDVGAGHAAGCYTILIGDGYNEPIRPPPDARCVDLQESAKLILSTFRSSEIISRLEAFHVE
jgi:D-glycero-D-manno-heptose 1,7-bisphosphate phosphatase